MINSATIICPYCHTEQNMDPTYFYEPDNDEWRDSIECDGCDKTFKVSVERITTYYCQSEPQEELEDAQ